MLTAGRTDIGRVRTVNEDRIVVEADVNGLTLAILADGMGGHQAGDVASQIAVETTSNELQSIRSGMTADELLGAIRQAITRANEEIYRAASAFEHYHGMGTTIVVAVCSEQTVHLGHIGDSRAYRFDGRSIAQLTEDHSFVNELIKSGQISLEEADQHPRRNVVTRALGTESGVEPDVQSIKLDTGDLIMLCSDGLSDLVTNDEMEKVLGEGITLDEKAQKLVELALAAGGDDNVTVILLSNDLETNNEKR